MSMRRKELPLVDKLSQIVIDGRDFLESEEIEYGIFLISCVINVVTTFQHFSRHSPISPTACHFELSVSAPRDTAH